nr:MAG TPA: hypothetical protein [Caudoviricetes sp.]
MSGVCGNPLPALDLNFCSCYTTLKKVPLPNYSTLALF